MKSYETGWYDGGVNLLKAIQGEPQDTNEEFTFGTFTLGFICGQSDRSAGFGLLLAVDIEEPEPGFQIVIGPLCIWWRRTWPLQVSVLHHDLIPEKKQRG